MVNAYVKTKVKCYHCGDECSTTTSVVNDKSFCCDGCKTVYELLQENNLCGYYDFERNPGIKIKEQKQERFAYLDNETIAHNLSDFDEGGQVRISLYIPKIHCASCVWLLENIHRLKDGVISSRVDFVKREIAIAYQKDKVSLRTLVELLDSFGYTPEINLNQYEKKKTSSVDRSIYYKLGVAAFCSANIMMLSFPSYFGMDDTTDSAFANLFGFISLILSLPVVFYSGQDFFISAYASLKNKQLNLDVPIALGIAAVFIRSIYEVILQIGPGYFDSLTGLLFFMLIGKWYQRKTYSSFSFDRDYQSYFPVSVLRLLNGVETPIPIRDLKKGDKILVRNQEIIPSDSILISGSASIDYSFVTGEALPIEKEKGALLYAGGRQTGDSILLEVEKEVSQSYLLQLWNKEVFKKSSNAYLSSFVLTFSKYFVYGTIVISIATFGYWYFVDFSKAFFALASVLLVACPCALALSLPFALGNSLSKLGSKGLFVKNADAVEVISEIDTIVFDKTGTLTQTDLTAIEYIGSPLSPLLLSSIKSAVRSSTHPLSRLIYAQIQEEVIPIEHFSEIPSKGIFCLTDKYQLELGSAFWVGLEKEEEVNESRVYLSVNGVIKGFYQIKNRYRAGIEKAMKELSENYDIHLLSGDKDKERNYLATCHFKVENMRFQQDPTDKLAYIEMLKAKGKKVMMIGDGLNDAGALKAADIGISVSEDVYNFSPACDGIIEGNKLIQLKSFLTYSKKTVSIIKGSLALSLLYNAAGLFFAVQGLLTPMVAAILMPMSSVTVVLFVIAATNMAAKRNL